MRRNVIILGAAGRDFHNFDVFFKDKQEYNVVAFTATQIPGIENRKYPAELAGNLYPEGIPIYSEKELPRLIKELSVDLCVFSYSDVSYQHVMQISSIVNSCGAGFMLLGPKDTMVKTNKPTVAVGAVRTGCGKSQTTRRIAEILTQKGLKVIILRHPMPYGNLLTHRLQRYQEINDLQKNNCTIEEMEEIEPNLLRGNIVYTAICTKEAVKEAENDPAGCDIILWEGGNNDFPFVKPDLYVCVTDPLRAGHELSYYPGEAVARMADVIVINKIDSASLENINIVRENISKINHNAIVIEAASPLIVDKPELIKGKKVLVIEDGPTLTHGEMKIGAGVVAAKKYGATQIIDPKPYAVGKIIDTFKEYPEIENILPATGYGTQQLEDLEQTINNTPCDVVIIATPVDLNRIINIKKPTVRVRYELQEIGYPTLETVINDFINKCRLIKKKFCRSLT